MEVSTGLTAVIPLNDVRYTDALVHLKMFPYHLCTVFSFALRKLEGGLNLRQCRGGEG